MAIIAFPIDVLRLRIRQLARFDKRIDVRIRFRQHDDPADVEDVRWNVQGNIHRRGGIRTAKGFKLRECALARIWFTFTLAPKQLKRFVSEILPYVEDQHVTVLLEEQRLTRDGLGVKRRA